MHKKLKNIYKKNQKVVILSVIAVAAISVSSILMMSVSSKEIDDPNTYTLPLVISQIKDAENIKYEGDLSENQIDGEGEIYYFGDTFGFVASGEFKNGTLDNGLFSMTVSYPEQDKSYSIRNEGTFNEFGLIGECDSKIEITKSGEKTSIYLKGYFENGKLNGLGNMTVFTDAQGKIYEASGDFKNGVIQKEVQ